MAGEYEDGLRDFETYRQERDSGKTAAFNLISLADLLEQPDPVYSHLVSEMLPAGGSSIVVAKPKIGKSTLIQQLARCVAGAVPFLGRETRGGTVIYLAFEEKDSEVKKSFRLAGAAPDLPIFFHFGAPPDDRFTALRDLIVEFQPALVVVDTLAYWMGLADFNDYGQVGTALRPLHALARAVTTHIMCVHHAGKGAGRAESIDSPLGSTALTGNVDTILVLSEHEGDQRVLESRQRYGEHLPKTLLSFDKDSRTYVSEGTVQDGRRRDLEESVAALIGRGTLTESAIRSALRCDKGRLLGTLDRLVEAGILLRAGRGVRGDAFRYSVAMSFGDALTDEGESYEF